MPVLHLIAGPHGAGKSTLHKVLIEPRNPGLPFINAHDYAQENLRHIIDPATRARTARAWADERRQALLREGRSFVTETAFSHASRVALLVQARTLGFEVVLYALGLDEPRRLLQRVSQRAREGGHAVPSHKVLERYARCLYHLRQAVVLADLALLIDACEAREGGPRLVASVTAGQMHLHSALRPRWIDKVLGFAEG
ncbi:MAG: zeta toxin family protein [Burkholderiales bacterium]|nr:zeta toxin family protein [Burkholderiales bacterium]